MKTKVMRNKRGTATPVAGMLMLILGVAILFVSIFITAELGDSVNDSICSSGNTDLQDIYNDTADLTYSALQIMGISLIVIGAGVVLSSLKNAF